jgi:hypothetical protein
MVAGWVNKGGVWTKAKKIFVGQGGAWKEAKKAWVGQGGQWKLFHSGQSEAKAEIAKIRFSNADETTYTWDDNDLGAAAPIRMFAVFLAYRGNVSTPTTTVRMSNMAAPTTYSSLTRVGLAPLIASLGVRSELWILPRDRLSSVSNFRLSVSAAAARSMIVAMIYRITGQDNDTPYWTSELSASITGTNYTTIFKVAPPETFPDGATIGLMTFDSDPPSGGVVWTNLNLDGQGQMEVSGNPNNGYRSYASASNLLSPVGAQVAKADQATQILAHWR